MERHDANQTQSNSTTSSTPSLSFIFGALLTMLSGFVDAIGFSQLAGLYLSFMSGNSTRVGTQIVQGDFAGVEVGCAVIASFVIGSLLGTLLSDATGNSKNTPVLLLETALFSATVLLIISRDDYICLLPVVAAMGAQNCLQKTIAGADIGKGFITGALFGFGRTFARWLTGKGPFLACSVFAFSWLAFMTGVVAGSVAIGRLGLLNAILIPGSTIAALTVVIAIMERRRSDISAAARS